MRVSSFLAGILAASAGAGVAGEPSIPLRVRVVEEATGESVAARVSLWRDGEPRLPAGFPTYSRGAETHFLVPGDFQLELEPGSYRLRLERGLEYVPVELDVEVPAPTSAIAGLRRWVDMNAAGWYAADMHVHRDPADVPLILEAEDLNFVPTIATHVWSGEVDRAWEASTSFPVRVRPRRLFTANAQEVERIQGGPGAVILLGRDLPLPFDGYELYPPSAVYTRQVHAQGGLVEGDKLFWLDTFVNAVLGEIDLVELNCNHFLPHGVDTDLVPWSHWPVELGYRGPRGFALWMMDLYYRLLNAGIELPLSAGSASGVKATPVGYDRLYVHLGEVEGALEYDRLVQAIREGRSFSTNGPILDLEVDGRSGPGLRLPLEPDRSYRLRARARSQGPLESLQLVVDGEVVAERTGRDAPELLLEETLRFEHSSWVAVRAFERSSVAESWVAAPQVFAHSSPLWFLREGRPVVVPESVRELIDGIDRLIEHTAGLEGFREESHREETLALYREARAVLVERLGSTAVGE